MGEFFSYKFNSNSLWCSNQGGQNALAGSIIAGYVLIIIVLSCVREMCESREKIQFPVPFRVLSSVLWKVVLVQLIFILTTLSNSSPVIFFYQGEEARPPLAQTLLGSLAVSIAPDACNALPLYKLKEQLTWISWNSNIINFKMYLVKCHLCPISSPQNRILN